MSAAAALLADLRSRGLAVTSDGITLWIDPGTDLTEDDREGIVALKPDLLRLLAGGQLAAREIEVAEHMNGAFDWRGRRRCACGELAIADGCGQCDACRTGALAPAAG